MQILYTVDNNFIPQLSASICSVCENNKQAKTIDFYIIVQNISTNNKIAIEKLAKSYHRTVQFEEIDHVAEIFSGLDTKGWNEIILARLLMDRFLPKNLSKILYLDGDTIVNGSLDELWNTDLEQYILAACPEFTISSKRKKILGLAPESSYVNSGVLLVNLTAWRHYDIGNRLVSLCSTKQDILFASDQDAINILLENKIKLLSPKYNYCNSYYFYPFSCLKKISQPSTMPDKQSFIKDVSNPIIIHFLGEERPWRKGNTHRFSNLYKYYLSLTPFKDTPQEPGWETYFFFWKLFNKATKHFPYIRYKIITSLIPIVMKARKEERKKKERRLQS